MDYFDALRSDGWLADPTDRVRVEAVHAGGCRGRYGGPCGCVPRVTLVADPAKVHIRDLANGEETSVETSFTVQ